MQKSGISLLSIWFHTIAVENSIQIVSECCKHFVHYAQYRGEKNIVMTEKEKFFFKKKLNR